MTTFSYWTVALFLMTSAVSAAPDSTERLGDLKQEIKTLNANQDKQKSKREELYEQLKAQSRKVSAINRKLHQLEQQIQQKDQEMRQLRTETGLTEQQQTAQLDALYTQIRAAYMNAAPSYIEMLLNQQNISTISRSSTYFRYFHDARKTQLDELNNLLSKLNEEQKQLLLAQQSLEIMLVEQQQQQLALQQETERRKVTLSELDKTISSNDVKLASLHEEQQNLQQLLDKLARQQEAARKQAEKEAAQAIAKPAPTAKPDKSAKPVDYPPIKPGTPFSRLSGKLSWPVSGKILANYGSSRNLGKLKWQGIVIASQTGNEVRATATGRVVFADWLRGFGLLIIIDHGEKYMTLYGNNDSLLRQVGDKVQAGEVIAQSGEQGIRGLAGLYFEIRHKGSPTNPLKWLAKQG